MPTQEDRSTPMRDTFFGGQDDLTGALAFEDDEGYTTVAFQKKLTRTEPTDHSIIKGLTHFIWAMGQQEGDYVHKPHSGLEKGNPSVENFYRVDEVKYHGKRNRGVALIDFFEIEKNEVDDEVVCESHGTYKFPSTCSEDDCDYVATWKNTGDGHIKVVVKQKYSQTSKPRWVAIAFSKDKRMPKTDIVAGFLKKDGSPYVGDFYASRYGPPKEDKTSSLRNAKLEMADGKMILSFEKQLSSQDSQDVDMSASPVHLMFPFSGGPVFGVNTLGMHSKTPFVSRKMVNLAKVCR